MSTLKNNLKQCTKKDLISIARFHHITGYSSLNKEELINTLNDYLLTPSVMETFFVYLGDDELDAFFHPGSSSSMKPSLFRRLREGGYCFLRKDGSLSLPKDVQNISLLTETFLKHQRQKSFLLDCLNAAGYLYGCTPVPILLKMYNSNTKIPIKKGDFLEQLREIPDYSYQYVLQKDLCIPLPLYHNNLYKKIQELLRCLL